MSEQGRTLVRIPLAVQPEGRDRWTDGQGTARKDSVLINCYIEKKLDGSFRLVKRPGLKKYYDSTSHGSTDNGIYSWNGHMYFVNTTTFGSVDAGSIGSVSGSFKYTFNVQQAGTIKLFFHNTVQGYVYDSSNGLVHITDANFASLSTKLVPGSAFLDGTMYVMDVTGTIWGSALGDATTWPVLNTIKAQIEPDNGIGLAKQQSYVVAFKQWTTEFFYDAANPTGSPLSPVPGAKLDIGCAHGDSIQDIGGRLVFLGVSKIAGRGFYLIQGLQVSKISTPYIDRLLDALDVVDNTEIHSWQIYSEGHTFYGITIIGSGVSYVYDLVEGLWAEWVNSVNSGLTIYASAPPLTSASLAYTVVQGQGFLYYIGHDYYTDDIGALDNTIKVDIYTNSFDAGNRRRKFLSQMEFICDQYQGSTISVRFTDDDYKTYSNYRTVDLNKKRAVLHNCGTFRKRAWHIRHTANTPLRLESIELDMILGSD